VNVPACLLDKWQGFFLGGGGTWGKMGLAVGLMVSSVLIYCCVRVLYFFEGVLFFGGGGGGEVESDCGAEDCGDWGYYIVVGTGFEYGGQC